MHRMEELYRKFLNRQCSEGEARQLLAYLKSPEGAASIEQLIAAELNDPTAGTALREDEATMEQVRNRLQQTILAQSVTSRRSKARIFFRYATAAAIVILAAVGYYFILSDIGRQTTKE